MLRGRQPREGLVAQHVTLSLMCAGVFLIAAAVSPFALRAQDAKPHPSAQKPSDRLDEALYWLPADTETIIVRNDPLKNEARPSERRPSDVRPAEPPFSSLMAVDDVIRRKTTVNIEGSRRFRAPHGFGLMPFQGCKTCVLEESATPALTAKMQAGLKKAEKTMTLAGRRVAVFTTKAEEDTWTLYAVLPRPNVYLLATHEGYLNTVLTQMEKKPSTRAMPRDLPEWKYVDMAAPIWAIRHYSKDYAAEDPSSPLRATPSGPTVADSGAIGLVFSGDPVAKRATVWYLSRAKDARAIVENFWHTDRELKVKIDEVKPGVIRTTTAAGNDDLWQIFMFLLSFQLGHGVWV